MDVVIDRRHLNEELHFKLFMHVRQNNQEKVHEIMGGSSPIEPNWTDDSGNGFLYLASLNGYDELVGFLLAQGCVVDILNKDSWTPLMAAARYGRIGAARVLLAHRPDPFWTDNDGNTAKSLSTQSYNSEIVTLLQDYEESLRDEGYCSVQDLSNACREELLDEVKLLLSFPKAKIDINYQNPRKELEAPIHIAVAKDNLDIVRYLAEKGANLSIQTASGVTPFMTASATGKESIVMVFISFLVDPFVADRHGNTALKRAKQAGKSFLASLLVEYEEAFEELRSVPDLQERRFVAKIWSELMHAYLSKSFIKRKATTKPDVAKAIRKANEEEGRARFASEEAIRLSVLGSSPDEEDGGEESKGVDVVLVQEEEEGLPRLDKAQREEPGSPMVSPDLDSLPTATALYAPSAPSPNDSDSISSSTTRSTTPVVVATIIQETQEEKA